MIVDMYGSDLRPWIALGFCKFHNRDNVNDSLRSGYSGTPLFHSDMCAFWDRALRNPCARFEQLDISSQLLITNFEVEAKVSGKEFAGTICFCTEVQM